MSNSPDKYLTPNESEKDFRFTNYDLFLNSLFLHGEFRSQETEVRILDEYDPSNLYSSHNGFRIKSEIKLSEYNCNQDLVLVYTVHR